MSGGGEAFLYGRHATAKEVDVPCLEVYEGNAQCNRKAVRSNVMLNCCEGSQSALRVLLKRVRSHGVPPRQPDQAAVRTPGSQRALGVWEGILKIPRDRELLRVPRLDFSEVLRLSCRRCIAPGRQWF